ncbi:MAG: VWA domain-containing protein [Nanoarchaeota archaeon]
MASISFLYARYLFFLFLIPLFIFIHIVTLKSAKSTALRFANFEAIARIRGVDIISKNLVILSLSILIMLSSILALSGLTLHLIINSSSHSFVLALDTSKSMEANDIGPNRMEAAKSSALKFVDNAPFGTRMGIVSFSGSAFIEQSVTEDKGLVKSAISNIVLSNVGGTDINEVVITGTNLLEKEDGKAIILLSDGQINVGSVEDAVKYATVHNVIIHTIAVGTEEGGETSYGLSKLDEDSLTALSYNTGGQFFRARDINELSDSFNNAIEQTSKSVGIDLSRYLLIASILLFFLEYYLINTKYRRLG